MPGRSFCTCKWRLLYITGYLNSVVASWLKLPAFYLPDELRGVGVPATATVGKTSTVSDAEKNGEKKNLNVHRGATLCLAESGGSNRLFLSTFFVYRQ